MKSQFKAVLGGLLFLKFLDFLTLKLNDLPTLDANHVIMMTLSANAFKKLPLTRAC